MTTQHTILRYEIWYKGASLEWKLQTPVMFDREQAVTRATAIFARVTCSGVAVEVHDNDRDVYLSTILEMSK